MNTRKYLHFALNGIFAAGLLFAAGKPALAERDWSPSCRSRLEADRARIDRDAARRGEHSPQVRRDVERMESDRRWCRDHHADWDHDRFDFGLYLRH
jgi:hypothetical protein